MIRKGEQYLTKNLRIGIVKFILYTIEKYMRLLKRKNREQNFKYKMYWKFNSPPAIYHQIQNSTNGLDTTAQTKDLMQF